MSETYVALDFPAAPARRRATSTDAASYAADADGADVAGTRLLLARPDRIIVAHHLAEVRPALREVEGAASAGAVAAGFVTYEAAPAFDSALAVRPPAGPTPLLWFGIFGGPQQHAAPAPNAPTAPTAQAARLAPAPSVEPLNWQPGTDRAAYDRAIDRIRAGIEAGDVYQVNHTLQLLAACPPECAPALYESLVAERHGGFNALIVTPEWSVVSASPELFVDRSGDVLTTRPMKGTVRRGRWLAEDRAAAVALAASAKDRAENLMIVDLLRNDLGRVASFGSVQVPAMFDVETYPTVHQLTSTVTARLRDGLGLDDVFAAMFPCGSVTGAPKVTAMRKIAELERSPRGPYCGAIGTVRPDGSFTFNVAIRTLLFDHVAATAVFGTGGGITWDSRAEAEFDELTAKAALVTERTSAFRLIETLRYDEAGYARLDGHLRRLAESAAYWGFDRSVAENAANALEHEARVIAADAVIADAMSEPGAWRVRLTAGPAGDIEVTHAPLDRLPSHRVVRPARAPVSRHDRLLFHKTTARAVYDRLRSGEPDAFDVLLWNEEGEVTEFTTGNVVALIDGVHVTPRRESGLLGGVFRDELLAEGRVTESVITLDAIRAAPQIWYVNSVRGCVPVTLEPDTEKGRIR